jgi:3-methyladenine DNA glycosylase/8-oxoguanine DNA glycosylase
MHKTELILNTPENFNFIRTVFSHGWCTLAPFRFDKEDKTLYRLLILNSNFPVLCRIAQRGKSDLQITATHAAEISPRQKSEITRQVASCLRLTEDIAEFYNEIRKFPKYRWIIRIKAGRLLRSPSVFEDVVKMICTTNCSWSLTETIVGNLVGELGIPFDDSQNCFPSAEALTSTTDRFLRKAIRAGYRSPYILEFAEKVANKKIDVERWRSPGLSTDSLYRELLSIKGVGSYAAGNILKLLGHYNYLGLDSWSRGEYYRIYHKGRAVKDQTIEKRYRPYGKWKGLLFWMEMTKHWYDHKFPF